MSPTKTCLVTLIAIFVPALASAEPRPLREACAADLKTLCGSIQPGGGRIRECIKQHRAELSTDCKVAIADRMLERQAERATVAPAGQTGPKLPDIK